MAGIPLLCGCSVALHLFHQKREAESIGNQDIAEIKAEPKSEQFSSANISQDLRSKSDHFEHDFADDIRIDDSKLQIMRLLVKKIRAVQERAGHGNFNIMGMDEFFRVASQMGDAIAVTPGEKNFLEETFQFDAKRYGFQGKKASPDFTEAISRERVIKIPHTGHYLRKGKAAEVYEKITKDVGSTITLSSGVRGIAKQFHLFFEKGLEAGGNMSKASRSLAPPGYSFHGHDDFDVGRKGLGAKNFTDAFARTEEYKKLIDLGYVSIRYTESNLLGVRFEPWHIKV
jgi:hypothetical protein